MLTSKQRAYLRKITHDVAPAFQIGKSGVTPEMIEAIRESIDVREVIKVTILKNSMEDTRPAAEMIAERTRSEVAYVIGRRFVLYKQAAKEADRKIKLN